MRYTKKVALPIEVSDCGWCWEPTAPFRICPHFDNEGGHPTCDQRIASLKHDERVGGVRKPKECLALKEV